MSRPILIDTNADINYENKTSVIWKYYLCNIEVLCFALPAILIHDKYEPSLSEYIWEFKVDGDKTFEDLAAVFRAAYVYRIPGLNYAKLFALLADSLLGHIKYLA